MRLPSFKRLVKSDFAQEDQNLVDQLGNSLNSGMEYLYQALNKKLTISDNLQATEKDVTVSVDANGTPTTDAYVAVDFGSQVRTLFVGKAENLTNSSVYPTSAPWISWSNTQNGIQINNVRGLPAGNRFRLRLVMFG